MCVVLQYGVYLYYSFSDHKLHHGRSLDKFDIHLAGSLTDQATVPTFASLSRTPWSPAEPSCLTVILMKRPVLASEPARRWWHEA